MYETALKRNARDSVLASKVGQALIKTHNYNKAVIYDETALKSEMLQFLRQDLAELYLKLRQFEKAERTVLAALAEREGSGGVELAGMIERVGYLRLLYRIHREAGRLEGASATLGKAIEIQSK